jgi:hypothetical protein
MEDLKSSKDRSKGRTRPKLRMENGRADMVSVVFDCEKPADDSLQEKTRVFDNIRAREIHALILLVTPEFEDWHCPLWGLVIAKVQGGVDYQRIGRVKPSCQALKPHGDEEADEDTRTITLV